MSLLIESGLEMVDRWAVWCDGRATTLLKVCMVGGTYMFMCKGLSVGYSPRTNMSSKHFVTTLLKPHHFNIP